MTEDTIVEVAMLFAAPLLALVICGVAGIIRRRESKVKSKRGHVPPNKIPERRR